MKKVIRGMGLKHNYRVSHLGQVERQLKTGGWRQLQLSGSPKYFVGRKIDGKRKKLFIHRLVFELFGTRGRSVRGKHIVFKGKHNRPSYNNLRWRIS